MCKCCIKCILSKRNNKILNIQSGNGQSQYSFVFYPFGYELKEQKISKNRFKKENNLVYIKLSKDIELIEEKAFEGCENLKIISYLEEDEPKLIGKVEKDKKILLQKEAFYNCINLETVIFPACNHLVIEKNAFENCQTLRTLILDFDDSGYLDIHPLAFSGCSKLVIITKSEKILTYCRNNGVEYLYVK